MQKLLIIPIRAYQYFLSPLFGIGNSCRYTPSCSQFAIEAIEQHGVFKGLIFSFRRLSRCHPWHAGGYDPVPEPKINKGAVNKACSE